MGRAGVHDDVPTREVATDMASSVQQGKGRANDVAHVRELALTRLAAGEPSTLGADEADTALGERPDVCLRRGMLPHVHVHARCHQHGTVHGQKRGRERVVRDAQGHLCDDVCRCRYDDAELGGVCQADVRYGGIWISVEARHDGVAAQGLEARRPHKAAGVFAHHDTNVTACLLEAPEDLAGLVGGDTATHGEHDRCPRTHAPSPSMTRIL